MYHWEISRSNGNCSPDRWTEFEYLLLPPRSAPVASLLQKPLAPTQLLSALEAELNSLNNIHTSYRPFILAANQLLKKEPSFDGDPVSNKHIRRSLLPFLGDALCWLTETATTKDVNSIKDESTN